MTQIGDSAIVDASAQVIAATAAGVVVELRWRDGSSSTPSEIFQVLRLRDRKVIDMEDHRARKTAMKALTRNT